MHISVIAVLLFFESLISGPTYKHGAVGFPKTFNPLYARTDPEKMVSSLVFKGLFRYDENQNIVPELADSFKVSEDGLSYEVTLKDSLKWHNGKPINANDVLYTASKSPVLREVSTDKIDERTVRFNLPNKFSPFLDILTLQIVPADSENNNDGIFIFGSGDFRILRVKTDKSLIKEVIIGTKDTKYSFKKTVFKFYENEDALMNAYKLGEINGFLSSGRFLWDNIKDFRVSFLGRYYVLIFNTKSKLMENANIRKGLASSIDYDKLFDSIISQRGIKANGPLSYTWSESEDIKFLEFSESSEKEVDPENKINIYYVFGELNSEVAKFVKKSWEKIGYSVDIFEIPQENLLSSIKRAKDFDVILMGQEVSMDPDRYVFWHSTQGGENGLNFGKYKSLRVDKALEEGRKAQDREERKKHYSIMQKVFIDEVPAIFLYHPTFHFYISNEIERVNLGNIYYPWEIFKNFSSWKIMPISNLQTE